MAQEIIPPNRQAVPTSHGRSQIELLDESIDSLQGRLNLLERIKAHRKAGKNAAAVVVAMQKDVAEAQREVVQYHANLIAKEMKIEIGDRFQSHLDDLTRRIDERAASQTRYYWQKLMEREDYYEELFEQKIRELRDRVAAGELTEERANVRISRYENDRDAQQEQDRVLLNQLRDACLQVVRDALRDYRPSA